LLITKSKDHLIGNNLDRLFSKKFQDKLLSIINSIIWHPRIIEKYMPWKICIKKV